MEPEPVAEPTILQTAASYANFTSSCYGELNMGKNGKSTKSPIFNFLINGRILFSVLDGANKKVRGWITYGGPPHYVSDP